MAQRRLGGRTGTRAAAAYPGTGKSMFASMGKLSTAIPNMIAGGALLGMGAALKTAHKIRTSSMSGTVGYGKRGIDANAHSTDGLVQGLAKRRRG